jgi:hypothetical protein
VSSQKWPEGANDGYRRQPIYTCSGCGMQSTRPITHDHPPYPVSPKDKR